MAEYQFQIDAFEAHAVQIVALSVDTEDQANALVERLGIKYKVVHDVRFPEHADLIGAYHHATRPTIHPAQFVIDADRKVEVSVYSTGPIGRLAVDEVLRFVS